MKPSLPTYQIDRSKRRKHTYLLIQNNGTLLIKTNLTTTHQEIEAFLLQKKRWIDKKHSALLQKESLPPNHIYLLGESTPLPSQTIQSTETLYRQKAKEIIPPLVETYSRKMQLYPTKISFRKAKTRWGSCSAKNSLSFNIHLMQTPLPFIEYVVVHELAHIRHKNHSKAFWSLVEEILPDYKERQALIKNRHFIL